MANPLPVTLEAIEAARGRLVGAVVETDCDWSRTLSSILGCKVWLKFENLQFTASFKERGALNRLSALSEEERRRGVIAMSAGNHAQGVAYHARRLAIPATIVMPVSTPTVKVMNTRSHGAEVVLYGETVEEAAAYARSIGRERGRTFIHPYDDPLVIAGQGTIALEMLGAAPEIDCLVVPIGGGGLISGIAAAIKQCRPSTLVIGVEPTGADVMSRSLAAGKPARMERNQTIADGLAAPFAGVQTLEHVQRYVDDIVLVDDEWILKALGLIMQRAKLAPEPAGAAAFAALLSGAYRPPAGSRVVCVVSGGNADPAVLQRALQS